MEKIHKEVFDKFFTENYCVVDYTTVKETFEESAEAGNDIFTEKSFYPKTMSAINVETTEQDALYVINEEDILTDTDTLADSNLNYDYWYLIVILPTNLKIYQTKAYEETVVSQ